MRTRAALSFGVALVVGCRGEPEEEPAGAGSSSGEAPASSSSGADDGSGSGGSGEGSGDTGGEPGIDPGWDSWQVRANDFAVPTVDTTYVCFGRTVTVTDPRQIVAFVPVVDSPSVVHHMILYRSADLIPPYAPCYPGPPDSLMLWGWGPGGEALLLPEEAGFPMGQQPGLVHYTLQVHYDNRAGVEGVIDRSGIDVYTTTELRPQHAGIVALGDVASLVIPPGQAEWPTIFRCSSNATSLLLEEPVQVFGSWLHAHELGRALWTDQYRGGTIIGELGRQDPYDFANQRFEPLQATIEPGDELRTHCNYDSTGQTEPVHGGGGTDDEMCLNYLMYYPAQPLFGICND